MKYAPPGQSGSTTNSPRRSLVAGRAQLLGSQVAQAVAGRRTSSPPP